MHADTLVNPVIRWLATRCVWGDDKDFVTVVAKVLDHPEHRVGDAVDTREETLCDDRNAHTKIVPSTAVDKVASGGTTHKVLVPKAANIGTGPQVFCATRKGG